MQSDAETLGPSSQLPLWAAAFFVVMWVILLSRFGEGDVYAVIGPYSCVVSVACLILGRREMRGQLVTDWRGLAIGLGVGVVITALTYPVFQLARYLVPVLDSQVQGLYSGARSTTLPKALLWLSAAIVAEELLFRGLIPLALRRLVSERQAYGVALLAYTLAQLGSGSVIVSLMALGYGGVWTVMRMYTRSLAPGLIAHAIWSPTLILLYPVT